jgi:hypothetical protein
MELYNMNLINLKHVPLQSQITVDFRYIYFNFSMVY